MAWEESKKVREILGKPTVQSQLVKELYGARKGSKPVVLELSGRRYRVVDVQRMGSSEAASTKR